MTFHLLKPILGMAALFMVMDPAWGAQNSSPTLTEAAPTGAKTSAAHKKKISPPGNLPFTQRIDVNSASKEELKKLPGIFDPEAAKIIAHRPYKSKAGLVVDAGLTGAQYFAIKGRVKAVQHSAK